MKTKPKWKRGTITLFGVVRSSEYSQTAESFHFLDGSAVSTNRHKVKTGIQKEQAIKVSSPPFGTNADVSRVSHPDQHTLTRYRCMTQQPRRSRAFPESDTHPDASFRSMGSTHALMHRCCRAHR